MIFLENFEVEVQCNNCKKGNTFVGSGTETVVRLLGDAVRCTVSPVCNGIVKVLDREAFKQEMNYKGE